MTETKSSEHVRARRQRMRFLERGWAHFTFYPADDDMGTSAQWYPSDARGNVLQDTAFSGTVGAVLDDMERVGELTRIGVATLSGAYIYKWNAPGVKA